MEVYNFKTVDDFIDSSKIINTNVANYTGETVYLDADIDLSGVPFEPIGNSKTYYEFLGTFDGKGHTIKNLAINSSYLQYVGLFGYSEGMTIKNVILDSSCSIESSYDGYDEAYVGGIIGYCYAKYASCNIESCVNKAAVAFRGNSSLTLGGIVSFTKSSEDYQSFVLYCDNY